MTKPHTCTHNRGDTQSWATMMKPHTHTHTPASTYAIRAESVSPLCDPRCAAGALYMNSHKPRSCWRIIREPLPSPHTRSLTQLWKLCASWAFLADLCLTINSFIHFSIFTLSPLLLLCISIFHPLSPLPASVFLSQSLLFVSLTSSLLTALRLSLLPSFPLSLPSIFFSIPSSPSPSFHSALTLMLVFLSSLLHCAAQLCRGRLVC